MRFARMVRTATQTAALMALIALSGAVASAAETDPGQLAQLIEYISADYPEAVRHHTIVNQDEYREMLEFSGLVVSELERLGPGQQTTEFLTLAKRLAGAVRDKENADYIREIATDLRRRLLQAYPVLSLPKDFLSTPQIQALYSESCAGCHGPGGGGNGPLATGLSPAPTDFTDQARAADRSVMGLYETITGGVDGTAMPSFAGLPETQRWSLALYVGSLAFNQSQSGQVSRLSPATTSISLQELILYSPQELRASYPALSYQDIGRLRAQPSKLAFANDDPLAFARSRLAQSRSEYAGGHYAAAQRLAVSAYLDGFELVENALSAHDPQLMQHIESDMFALRELLKQEGRADEVNQAVQRLDAALLAAGERLASGTLEGSTVFIASFLILLREGLEAVLVVLALGTVLIKSGRRDALKYMHAGWISAVVAGVLTWFASQYLLVITGASREITEGVAALLAAVVLFYVGFWMHRKTQIHQWQQFISESIHRHLGGGALFGISALAFIAVYRELFETVLFYQALWTQVHASQATLLVAGLLAGVAVLAVLSWLIVKYSIKLPLKRFFSITVYLLLALSFVLMGKAVAALQEAGLIGVTPFIFPLELEWLGIHPSWQGISAQAAVLLLSVGMVFIQRVIARSKKLMPRTQS